MSKRSFQEEESTVAATVRQFTTAIPPEFDLQVGEFKGVVSQPRRCVFCQQMFSKRDVGMLSCLFHPNEFFNRGVKYGNYHEITDPSHTNCQECTRLTLFTGKLSTVQNSIYSTKGCTRIDHCESLHVLEQPISAIPVSHLGELNIFFDAKRTSTAGSNIEAAIRSLRKRSNVIIIDKPRQLTRALFVDMPGTAVPFSMSVMEIYEAMTKAFGLPSIDDQVRRARAADPELRPTKHGGMYTTTGAGEFDRIRSTLLDNNVSFIPMVIVARVDQETLNSIGMKLRKI